MHILNVFLFKEYIGVTLAWKYQLVVDINNCWQPQMAKNWKLNDRTFHDRERGYLNEIYVNV